MTTTKIEVRAGEDCVIRISLPCHAIIMWWCVLGKIQIKKSQHHLLLTFSKKSRCTGHEYRFLLVELLHWTQVEFVAVRDDCVL